VRAECLPAVAGENCRCSATDIPGTDRLWRRTDDRCTFVLDHDTGAVRPSTSATNLKSVADFRTGPRREPNGKRRELSQLWGEHIESHVGGSVADCGSEDEPLVLEANVQDIRDLGLIVDHTPESEDPYPYCAHAAVTIPKGEERDRLSMRFAGALSLIFPPEEVRATRARLES
jgi:hypothetical protein